MDRLLGILLVFFGALVALVSIPAGIFLAAYALLGWPGRNVPVGWRGHVLFLGQRTGSEVGEGRRWAPLPFSLKLVDCREITLKTDPLQVFTQDEVLVDIDGSIIYKVVDTNQYLSVDPAGIKQGLDDLYDEVVRLLVIEQPLSEVLKLQVNVSRQVFEHLERQSVPRWGIRIIRVPIPTIKPHDPKVSEDLALRKREQAQTEGQKTQFRNFLDRVEEVARELKKTLPDLPSADIQREAIRTVQAQLGVLTQTSQEIKLTGDGGAETIAKALGRH